MSLDIEFRPWSDIPDSRKRESVVVEREVLGETFLGEPVWLPWMGVPDVTVEDTGQEGTLDS